MSLEEEKEVSSLRGLPRGILQRAVTLGLIRINPADRIEDREVRKADYLVREDLTRLLTTAERVCPVEHPIFLVMATAGLRIGETVAPCGRQTSGRSGPMTYAIPIRRSPACATGGRTDGAIS